MKPQHETSTRNQRNTQEPIFRVIREGKRLVIHFQEGARLGTLGFAPADIRRLVAAFRKYAVSDPGSSDGDT